MRIGKLIALGEEKHWLIIKLRIGLIKIFDFIEIVLCNE